MAKVTKRWHFHKGDPPGDQAQSWMTQEDWDRYDKYVEELKASGEYGKPDYVDISYDPADFKAFELTEEEKAKPMFTNFGLMIPQGEGKPPINWIYEDKSQGNKS